MITKNMVTIETLQEDMNIMSNFVQYFEFSPILYSFSVKEVPKKENMSYEELLNENILKDDNHKFIEINKNEWKSFLIDYINEWMTSSVKLLLYNLYFNIAIKTKVKNCDEIYENFIQNKFKDKKEYLNDWMTNKLVKDLSIYTNNEVFKMFIVSDQIVTNRTDILIDYDDKIIHLKFQTQE